MGCGWFRWGLRACVAVAVGCALGACAGSGRPLSAWHLDGGGDVTLPSTLLSRELPVREVDFVLRAEVPLAPDERGQLLTIVFACYHGPLALEVDGVRLVDEGDTGVGEHLFTLPPAVTDRPALSLAIFARQDGISALFGMRAAPRLAIGAADRSSAVFDRVVAVAGFVVILVFGLIYGALYLLDRRRVADGAFAAQALAALALPLLDLGALRHLQPFGLAVYSFASQGMALAFVAFVHHTFAFGRLPRWLVAGSLGIGATAFLGAVSFVAGTAVQVTLSLLYLVMYAYVGYRLVPLAVRGSHRFDARLVLAAQGITLAGIVPWLLPGFGGPILLGGWHVEFIGVFSQAISQTLILTRQHVARSREAERANHELQRQVAERSKELADALAKLGDRSPSGPLDVDTLVDGRYRVVRRLGAGGMGTVHEVERTSDGVRFALKTMRGRDEPASVLARFAREAQIAAEITHPNLVPVVDIGIANGRLFLVMPVIDGGSLAAARARFGDAAWARPLLAQIAAGLAVLHARGIVHRDLKPGNILLDRGVARIADFGLASLRADVTRDGTKSLTDVALAATAAPAAALTRAGDVFGTPAYMAPELAGGVGDAPPASDVFAFGVLAYEMVSGRAPFEVAPVLERMAGHAIAPPAPPAGDDALASVILSCLDLDPTRRPTAPELARALGATA
jgi:hypothetical protein